MIYGVAFWKPAIRIARSTNPIEARIIRLEQHLAERDDPAMRQELAALKSAVQPIRG
jgi:hypothetical protein